MCSITAFGITTPGALSAYDRADIRPLLSCGTHLALEVFAGLDTASRLAVLA